MAAPAPRSDVRGVVAEALVRLRGDLERACRRRFPTLDASDAYQRVCLRALERCGSLRDRRHVDGWVRRIASTVAFDLLRQRHGRGEPCDAYDLAVPASDGEVCSCTLALMKVLPESYEDILRRVDIEGCRLAEVASALRIATGNAAVRLHRARRALRDALREHCGVETMRACQTCPCSDRGCCDTA